jgi:hypothetical protein
MSRYLDSLFPRLRVLTTTSRLAPQCTANRQTRTSSVQVRPELHDTPGKSLDI